MTETWHIITGEYPPELGGVSDYTFQVAGAMGAAGHRVFVWCPAAVAESPEQAGVTVIALPGGYTPTNLRRIWGALVAVRSGNRLLVQWVPHAFGLRSMNVPFCLWVLLRSVYGKDVVDLMIHEAFLDVSGSTRQRLAAVVQRGMMALLLLAASSVWVSVPRWWKLVRPYALGRRLSVGWLSVPSNVPANPPSHRVKALKVETAGAPSVGHFGTFGPITNELVLPVLGAVLTRCPKTSIRLVGRGATSAGARLASRHPDAVDRIFVADGVPLDEVASQLAACDVLVQPYLDGVSGRRSSLMAGLALGLPVVTHAAECTESIWHELGACLLVKPTPEAYADGTAKLLADTMSRHQLGAQARRVYQERFDVRHTIARLCVPGENCGPSGRLHEMNDLLDY